MAAFALQALAWYTAALSLSARHQQEPVAASTPVPFDNLQDDIDALHEMLEKQFKEDEEAVDSELEKANETENAIEEAYNESDTLHDAVQEGDVNISSKNNESISEGLEDSAKASKEAKKEMKDFKETAQQKLIEMKGRAREMMLKYRKLAEESQEALDHARELEKNLTSARETMTVAKDTVHASIMQSQEAYDMLVQELEGMPPTTTTTPMPSAAWAAGLW